MKYMMIKKLAKWILKDEIETLNKNNSELTERVKNHFPERDLIGKVTIERFPMRKHMYYRVVATKEAPFHPRISPSGTQKTQLAGFDLREALVSIGRHFEKEEKWTFEIKRL